MLDPRERAVADLEVGTALDLAHVEGGARRGAAPTTANTEDDMVVRTAVLMAAPSIDVKKPTDSTIAWIRPDRTAFTKAR